MLVKSFKNEHDGITNEIIVINVILDPGPPSEEEMAGPCPGRLAVEKLKETVNRLPKRRQHLPGHPG